MEIGNLVGFILVILEECGNEESYYSKFYSIRGFRKFLCRGLLYFWGVMRVENISGWGR